MPACADYAGRWGNYFAILGPSPALFLAGFPASRGKLRANGRTRPPWLANFDDADRQTLLPFHHASIRGNLIMVELRATSAGTVLNIQSPRHPSAGRFIRQAVARGFRIAFQAAWPNSAGWVALAAPRSDGVDLIVRYYRDQTFTVQLCRPGLTLDELLPDGEATAA